MQTASTRRALRLLIVESSADQAAKLTAALAHGGYDPQWQRVDSTAALSAALSEHDWDLVLCGESGGDILLNDAVRLIRQHPANPSIIVLSPRPDIAAAVEAMRSGAVFGYRGLIRGILDHLRPEIEGTPVVVATGGDAPVIAESMAEIDHIDPDLTLDGLRLAALRNLT